MLTENCTAKDLRSELKLALNTWKDENQAPKLEIEDEPELPEPFVIALDKGLIVFETINGNKAALHITEHQTARRIELSYEQCSKLMRALIEHRKAMKEHRGWQLRYKDLLRTFEFEQAAWQRRFSQFKESVETRLGIVRELE